MINQIHEAIINNDCSLEIGAQTMISEDDDHPPSSRRTQWCAINNLIVHAWFRKA